MIDYCTFVDCLGIFAGLLFVYSGIPVVIQCIKTGSSKNYPKQLMWCVFFGAIFMFTYITLKLGFDWLVLMDKSVTTVVWAIVIYYRYYGEKDS